ncbi:autoinducer binding domain-containing protein [Niveispirillum fermenti]|uniref:autoinducer binding domain-containing protein n=1 Tax=Niveispirillum fermenti TaxID=1233113 RepID=UPI003A8AFF2D
MRKRASPSTHAALDAAQDFADVRDRDGLWTSLNAHLAGFGITGSLYGTDAFPERDKEACLIINSIQGGWLAEKIDQDLFYCDQYVSVARFQPSPVLWSDTTLLSDLSPAARASVELDFDHGILAGVTIPMRFAGGLGGSSIGCHAAGTSFAEFDAMWHAHGRTISAIVHAFDTALRERFAADIFPLDEAERSCLEYLATGSRIKQIAHGMRRTERQIRSLLAGAIHKLRAASPEQAIATALIFGLITP